MRLTGYDELLIWAQAAGLIDAMEHRALAAEAEHRPAAARKVVREAIALREALAALLGGGDRAALERLNATLAATRFSYRLEPSTDGSRRPIASGDVDTLRAPLAQLVHDTVEFLASDRLAHLGHCANHRCGWFFVDPSRNKARLWCEMASCGNNAKARAFYRRRRSSRATP